MNALSRILDIMGALARRRKIFSLLNFWRKTHVMQKTGQLVDFSHKSLLKTLRIYLQRETEELPQPEWPHCEGCQ